MKYKLRDNAASLWNFVYPNDVLVYNSGYDPLQYGALSPGIVLFAHSIQESIVAKRRRCDFLRGNEEYKYRFGAIDTEVMELRIKKLSWARFYSCTFLTRARKGKVAICAENGYNTIAKDSASIYYLNDAVIAKTGVGGKDGFNGRTKQSPGGKTQEQARQRGN